MRLISIVLTCFLVLAAPLRAAPGDPVPGQEAPAFAAAVEAWLAGDEAAALPVLARLAGEGSAAARMLLALIDKMPEMQGPWLSSLPKAGRMALLRAPGGLSGTSWMRPAAEDSPRAALWLRLWSVEAPVSLALDFARAGESRAAREALVFAAARERTGFAGIADDPDYPPGMRYLVWREWRAAGADDRIAEDAAALGPGDPQRQVAGLDWDAAAWPGDHPLAAPLAMLCADRCPDAPAACARDGLAMLGGYDVLAQFGSPSETLIPAARFSASARGQGALMRRMMLSGRARTEPADTCLARAVAEEAERY
jgi:hypothetical protein